MCDECTNDVSCLLVGLGTAKAEDKQVAVGVCASKALAVGGEFTVEHGSMTLALNLDGFVTDRQGEQVNEWQTHERNGTVKDIHQHDPFDREFAIKP